MFHTILFEFLLNWWTEIILILATIIFSVYGYYRYKFLYWKQRGIPYIPGKFPCGALIGFITTRISLSEAVEDVYNEGKGHKYVGYYSFWSPSFLIRDPELIKNITVKHFDSFFDRGMYYNDKDDPLSAHLFALDGIKWKTTRAKLTSSFATGKIKMMYQTMMTCALQLQEYLQESIDKNQDILDIKHLIARHSVNVIANTAVGIEGHSLKDESKLSEIAFKATEPTAIQGFRFGVSMLSKEVAKLLQLRFTPKEVEKYYLELTKQIVDYRSKNNIVRNDFMNNLMEIWDKSTDFEKRTDEGFSLRDIAAQTFLFILAAYESTSSTLCFTLYELAANMDIQEKLIDEVDKAGSLENMTYEKLLDLKYMDMVLSETWRKYPPGGVIFRECQKDYELPDGQILEKGITVTIPVLGLHRDPELFPEPEKYDPERFNKESPSQVIKPFSYIPFGEGPRFCIGKRYGLLQTKITLFSLISKFKFEITDKTRIPPKLDPKVFVLNAEGGMYLKAVSRVK